MARQRLWHTTRKPIKRHGYPTQYCDGPRTTPGAPAPRTTRLPVHFRDFGSGIHTLCGMVGGATRPSKWRKWRRKGQVTWNRIKVDLSQTTCPDCLVLVIQRCKRQLHERLAQAEDRHRLRTVIRQAHGRQAYAALDTLVAG